MSKAPQNRSPELKLKLAIEALKGEKAITLLATEYGIHPKQIMRWRDKLLDEGEDIFIHKATQRKNDPDKHKLLSIIDQLNIELSYLKKKLQRND